MCGAISACQINMRDMLAVSDIVNPEAYLDESRTGFGLAVCSSHQLQGDGV